MSYYFNLETYVLDYCISDEFRKLEEAKLLSIFHSWDEVLNMILTQGKGIERKEMYLWKEDALENMLYQINSIMNKV